MIKNANAGGVNSGAALANSGRNEPALDTKTDIEHQARVIGAGINNNSRRCSVGDYATDNTDGRPDPRLVFLERASARLILVEAGLIELEDAIEGLVAAFANARRP
jgi:hypothetical protein